MSARDAVAAADPARREMRALVLSIVGSAVLGVGATVWGVLVAADVLVFDGIFMLASIALAGISVLASRVASAPPSTRYPFGRPAATPIAVTLQGAALLATLAYAVATAIGTIRDGGSPVSATVLIVYGAVSGIAAWLVAAWIGRIAPGSDLARAEVLSWRSGALLSGVVAAGGVVAALLRSAGRPGIADYVDPVLVLVAVALVSPLAVRLLRDGMHELLEGAPSAEVTAAIAAAIRDTRAEHGLPEPSVRANKLGRRLYLVITFVVEEHRWEVDDEDAVRRALEQRLDALPLEVWAAVELTTDPSLAD